MRFKPMTINNANTNNTNVSPVISDKYNEVTLNICIEKLDDKAQTSIAHIINMFELLFHRIDVVYDEPVTNKQVLYSDTNHSNNDVLWIKHVPFEQSNFGLSEKPLMNRLAWLYQGLTNRDMNDSELQMLGEINDAMSDLTHSEIHSSKMFDWKQVVSSNGTFDLDLSTKRLFNKLHSLLKHGSINQAVAIMNILGLTPDLTATETKSIA